MSEHETEIRGQLKRGFAWLGAASAITRALDACFTLGVLWLVTPAELGLATLAWSFGMFLEAFNGLGVGTALVQSEAAGRSLLASASWYSLTVALALIVIAFAAAPLLGALWDSQPLVALVRASSLKLLFTGLAVVPLAQLNRGMRFERIALSNTLSTFCSGLVTLSLALLGFGAWSLVLGQVVYGMVNAATAWWLSPVRLQLTLRFDELRPLAVFGLRAAAANVAYQLYRNADYLLLGRFLGVSAVGIYRVGFELAMAPTQAVLNVVNRAALPAYARLQMDRPALTRALTWTIRTMILMLAPITAVLSFGARDVLAVVRDGVWIDASSVTAWLAWAALLRSVAHLFPQVFYAIGRPQLALLEAVTSGLVLCISFATMLALFGSDYGIITVGWAWFAGGALLLVALFALASHVLPLSLHAVVSSLAPAVTAIGVLLGAGLSAAWIIPYDAPPLLALSLRVALLGGAYWAFLHVALHMRVSDLRANRAGAELS